MAVLTHPLPLYMTQRGLHNYYSFLCNSSVILMLNLNKTEAANGRNKYVVIYWILPLCTQLPLSSPFITRCGHLTSPSPTTDCLLPSLRWTLSSCTPPRTYRTGPTATPANTGDCSRAQRNSLNEKGIVQLCNMCTNCYIICIFPGEIKEIYINFPDVMDTQHTRFHVTSYVVIKMAHYKGAASEGTRAQNLLKKREKAKEEFESLRKRIEDVSCSRFV